MKLQKLIIKNFRGLVGENNEIDFSNSDIIFLIGQNNVGKSSLLRAYEFFIDSKQKAVLTDFSNYDKNIPIEIEGVFIKEQGDDENQEFAGSGRNPEPDWVQNWVNEEGLVRVKKIWTIPDETYQKYTFSPQQNGWVLNGFGGLPTLFQKYAPTPIYINAMETEASLEEKVNKLIQDDFIKKLNQDHPDDLKEISRKILELQEKITGSVAIQRYNQELNTHFKKVFSKLTLKIEPKEESSIKVEDSFKKNHSVNVRKDGIARNETFMQHGHGVIRQALFNFLAFLKKEPTLTRKEYIVLYEEPELFLHPKPLLSLRQGLYDIASNSPYQIICATHSPMMIDLSKPHSSLVRIIKEDDETTRTFQVGDSLFQRDDEQKNRVQMINRFNPHICEAFYANKVILVEGDTETIVYRELLRRFYMNEDIFVLNTASKNNMPFFQEILTAFRIEHYVIHDTDTRTSSTGNANPAWSLNESIWQKINDANQVQNGLARRYVHVTNFETAHDIPLNGKDKPIKAYNYSKTINENASVPCLKWLRDLLGSKSIVHDQEYIENQLPLN